MTYLLEAVPFLVIIIYLWRNQMSLLDKVAAASAAADAALAKSAAKDVTIANDAAQIATLTANQNDPAVEQQISDGLDALIAKLSA